MSKTTVEENGLEEGAEADLKAPAFLAKCLGDENRLRILFTIGDGEKSVSAIVEALGLSQPLVSHHLRELKRALLVSVERRGPFVYYRLSDRRITGIVDRLQALAQDLIADRSGF